MNWFSEYQDIFTYVDEHDLQHIYPETKQECDSWDGKLSRARAASVPLYLQPPVATVPQRRHSHPTYKSCDMEVEPNNYTKNGLDMETITGLQYEEPGSDEVQDISIEDIPEEDPSFKLGTSKSPVIDALVYCALKNYGLKFKQISSSKIEFMLFNFPIYYQKSQEICSKARPTEDVNSRVKALQRWFHNFPTYKVAMKLEPCLFSLQYDSNPENFGKLMAIIEKEKSVLQMNQLHTSRLC